jgi:hypothetical protein
MPDPPSQNGSQDGNTGTLYSSSGEALKKLASEFEYWSGKLTETSLQMCYAIIAADWLLFGSTNGILKNGWAKYSVFMVLVALGANIIGAFALSEVLKSRITYAEDDKARWKREFEEFGGKNCPWPFTSAIEDTGRVMRGIKGGFTLLAGVLTIIGALTR